MCKTKSEDANFSNPISMASDGVLEEGVSSYPPEDRSFNREPVKYQKLEYTIGEYCCMMGFYHDFPEIPKSEVSSLIKAVQEIYPDIDSKTINSIIDEYVV